MNGNERDKLEDIHDDVRQTRTQIQVIDERTATLDARMEDMRENISTNRNDISDLQSTVRRNSTFLGGIATGATALLLYVADKLSIIFP